MLMRLQLENLTTLTSCRSLKINHYIAKKMLIKSDTIWGIIFLILHLTKCKTKLVKLLHNI